MIRFTNATGSAKTPLYLNPEKIVSVELYEDGTCSRLHIGDDVYYFVEETPAEVARKLLEWRLAMERYRAYVTAAALDENPQSNESWELAANAKAELVRLAGLEEPNHD